MFYTVDELLAQLYVLEIEAEQLTELIDSMVTSTSKLDPDYAELLMEREDVLTRIGFTLDDLNEFAIFED
jgi:hypothetical protein